MLRQKMEIWIQKTRALFYWSITGLSLSSVEGNHHARPEKGSLDPEVESILFLVQYGDSPPLYVLAFLSFRNIAFPVRKLGNKTFLMDKKAEKSLYGWKVSKHYLSEQ